ncbi:hypothetical protein SASPL_131368 [Salvia splendens]|uniref:SAP domain-containing protein n=1 Tax=Salvia splendens TaxID=180675 RepID=A0A8X8XA04_SALSN|nr:hypothetical protein SASPL_131368 [Salvia splendens]
MDIDPEDVFGDEDDPENEFYQEDQKCVSHFEAAINSISVSLKTQIINRSYDEVAICFFNTKEKKNLQDLIGVYVFNVPEREDLDRPTARLIKEFDRLQESFSKQIGSKYGILPGTRDNSLYNALWAAQALLRKGSTKTADKRILLFTNEDDPFGDMKGVTKLDLMRTTIQRAKDAQDLGISIELLPLSKPDDDFNVSTFYADLLGLEGNDLAEFKALAAERFEDIKDQLRKRMFRKRKVRRINFIIPGGKSIELNTYAVVRPTNPGNITWLDSAERSFFCSDTGALLQDPPKYFQTYKSENIMFTANEVSDIKRVSTGHLRLLGFKPLSCLKDYHNLRPSTFVFPSDEEVVGSTCIFIALHRSMLRLKRFAVAFYGNSTHPQLVALIAQDEIMSPSGQIEPPGMHMIYLPYSDDIRPIEEFHTDTNLAPRASEDQIKSASSLLKRIDLKNFSVCQFANPALQKHYAVLQALALDEDEIPDVKDETLPDEEGLARPGVVKALEELKICVYGENFKQEDDDTMGSQKTSETSNKRKALKELTVSELKHYLNVHNQPVGGKKEALISRILTHMGK